MCFDVTVHGVHVHVGLSPCVVLCLHVTNGSLNCTIELRVGKRRNVGMITVFCRKTRAPRQTSPVSFATVYISRDFVLSHFQYYFSMHLTCVNCVHKDTCGIHVLGNMLESILVT